jgi:ATP synthase protein I
MSKHAPNDRLSDINARLNRLKEEHSERAGTASPGRRSSGYGMAFTIAADLVGGVMGGAGLGWLLDRWLGMAPLGLITFFFLGAAAGMWNVYRTVRGYDQSLGFRPAKVVLPAAKGDENETPAGARSGNEGGDHRGQSTPSVPGRHNHPDPDRQR